MKFPSMDTVKEVKNKYPAGTKGTVLGADDTASLLMRLDNGSGLNVVYNIDEVKIIKEA